MKDDLGDRMKKQYEDRTRYSLPRRTYTIIRLDGKAFHTYTRGMKRPFDEDLIEVMNNVTIYLCENIQGCKLGYTQSDEISLLLTDFSTITTDAWFDGNIQKMVSVAASLATAKFNKEMEIIRLSQLKNSYDKAGEEIFPADIETEIIIQPLAFFDSRVFTIPDPIEVENYFVWRQKDAVRNSISMHAQSLYSHKELHGKSQSDLQDMIHDKGQNWNDLPDGFKRGRTIYYDVIRENWNGDPGNIIKAGWKIHTLDFLKEREVLSDVIPKINESLT
jgi:tRNA(His) guanylyltransferase